jgi:phosphate:Na+ symporter
MPSANPLYSFDLWGGLLGGLALFLFGMDVMTGALKSASGDYLKDFLGKLTRNRFAGISLGAGMTAIIQSSSVTTVVLIGLITAGLMSTSQSVAVIMGANIGTTITAQVLAFDVARVALPMIALGFGLSFLHRRTEWRQVGMAVLGLGMVFYGMGIMSSGLEPLRSFPPFIDAMANLKNPVLGVLVGAGFTALIQSSSATTGIILVLASHGLIGLGAAIAIALGANIGTCVTAGLASIGKPREAVRAFMVHTLFNVFGVMIWIGFIPQLAELAAWMSPAHPELTGIDRLAAEAPRQVANAHTLFNIANTLLLVGFTAQFARLVEWLIPDRPVQPDRAMLPRHLDYSLVSAPPVALGLARREVGRLGQRVSEMADAIMPAAISGSRADLARVAAMDKVVDALHLAIIDYLGKVSSSRLSARQSRDLMQLIEVANDLEHIGDDIATRMVTSASKRIDEDVSVSEQTASVLTDYHAFVVNALKDAVQAISEEDAELAKEVSKRKKAFVELSHRAAAHGLGRLTANLPNRLKTYAREMEVLEILDGVFMIVRRMARTQYKPVDPYPPTAP